jgi:hypothetical protein
LIVVLKKVWNDPVGSKLIAAAIIAAVGGWVAYHWSNVWLPALQRVAAAAWAFLLAKSLLSHWAVGLLLLGDVLFLVLLAWVVLIATQAGKEKPPEYLSYTSDNFYGLKWVWKYEGMVPRILAALCSCGFQVNPDDNSIFASSLRFHCENCRRTIPVEGHSWGSLQDAVMRHIQLRLRQRYGTPAVGS